MQPILDESNNQQTKLLQIPQHSQFLFSEPKEPEIYFTAKFDSGNLKKVHRNAYDHYSIWTAVDAQGSENQGYPKSWFYFRVGGFKDRRVHFSIHRLHFLWALTKKNHLYRPVYRQKLANENGPSQFSQWKRLPHPVQSLGMNNENELVVKFDFVFSRKIEAVEFAFIYPYSHEECHKDMRDLEQKYQNDDEIFFKRYTLCRTYQQRAIDMLLISSHQGKEGFQNIKTDNIFNLDSEKLIKFRENKPIIFISARVHPIETPSSYTMTGVINFLLNKEDYRAHLLRKYFVFVLVPMLNPDGVSNGHCRMDALNQNLNRYYKNPDPIKQPSCYAVKKLCEHFTKDKRLFMYLDLHAHPANKGNFIFGNAIFDYIEQVESHLFPKILSQNCINFQFEQCIFSRKHMKAKDRNEDISKQGCGRVVFYKDFGLTHSYTLECGYHCNTYNNILQKQSDPHKIYFTRYKKNQKGEKIYDNFEDFIIFKNEESQAHRDQKVHEKIKFLLEKKNPKNMFQFKAIGRTQSTLDDNQDKYYNREVAYYEPETFDNLGRNICVSILDVWNKNPYTRVNNANEQRKQIADRQAKLDRFRKQQAGIRTKQKNIIQLIETRCYADWHKRNVFQIQATTDYQKKNLTRVSQKVKRTEKSITTTDTKKQLSVNPRQIFKNSTLSRKPFKEEKRMGTIQPQIEQGIKSLSNVNINPDKERTNFGISFNPQIQSKNHFKPLNLRIRNMHLTNLNR